MKIEETGFLYAIQSPDGDFIYTTISTSRGNSIEEFVTLENLKLRIVNFGRNTRGEPRLDLREFKAFEDEGYKCVPIEIISAKSCAQH